ncbi:MAG TPA: hypothetical protein VIH99_01045 [Bdellovibrionota bacterium]
MKLFKLISMVALLSALFVHSAQAEVGRDSGDSIVNGSKLCEKLADSARKPAGKPQAASPAKADKEEAKDSTNAL